MKLNKRWTLAEKSLLVAPLLVLAFGGALQWRKAHQTRWLALPDTNSPRLYFSPDSQQALAVSHGLRSSFEELGVYDLDNQFKVCTLQLPPLNQSIGLQFIFPDWSPDGKRIASVYTQLSARFIAGSKGPSTSRRFTTKFAVWDAKSGRLLGHWSYPSVHADQLAQMNFSKDGRRLLGSGASPTVFDAVSGAPLCQHHSKPRSGGLFNEQENLIALGDDQHQVQVLGYAPPGYAPEALAKNRTVTPQVLWKSQQSPVKNRFFRLTWNFENVLGFIDSVSPTQKRQLRLWDGNARRVLPSYPGTEVVNFAFNGHAPLVAINVSLVAPSQKKGISFLSPTRQNLVIWNYRTGRVEWSRLVGGPFGVRWSPDGKMLVVDEMLKTTLAERAANQRKSMIRVLGVKGEVLKQAPRDYFQGTLWSPDSKSLAIAGQDGIEIVAVDNLA
jgi:dipeptidyl aminopeptidase/acylaminoacyl peptidase